jgi:hypothetical protein
MDNFFEVRETDQHDFDLRFQHSCSCLSSEDTEFFPFRTGVYLHMPYENQVQLPTA